MMFRIGTRGSPLALAQAHMARDALVAAHGWAPDAVEIVVINTQGDRVQDRPLAEIGGKALWTKELDAALLDGRIDCGVHSMKDVETVLRAGIALVAMLPRADVHERLLGAASIADLPEGAVVGTSSPRRAAQLKALRPDLRTETLRGNVATRMAKVEAGAIDATLLAAAGLDRLGVRAGHRVPLDQMLPASAQGAVGITARADDARAAALLAAIDDAATHEAVLLERGFLAALGGSCHSPVAALAVLEGDAVHFRGEILAEDGSERLAGALTVARTHAAGEVAALAARLLGEASPGLRALFAG